MKEESTFKKRSFENAGPVITISREVGCNGIKLANLLAAKLNSQSNHSKWNVLSKEIFYKSAHELDLHPEKIRQTFKKSDKYTFEQIIKAFGDKRYKSEAKITNTVRDVVHSLAQDGYNIIVGRAGHIIAKDIQNSLHLRLIAPLEYRIFNIMENNGLNHGEAKKFIATVEDERKNFRNAYKSGSMQEDLFDLIINRASFSTEEIIDLVVFALEEKNHFSEIKTK